SCTPHVFRASARPSPRVFAAIVVVEPARVGRAELRDDATHGADALLRCELRIRPAHVSLDPSGIEDHAGDPARPEIDRGGAHRHVHGGLRCTISDITPGSVVSQGSHAARDRHDEPPVTLCHTLEKRLAYAHWTQNVHIENPHPRVVIDGTNRLYV